MLLAALAGRAQYQLPNPGFEQWDNGNINAEPSHWNSFATSDGSYSSIASSPHHYHRSGGRPGTAGSNYLTIYSTSVWGVVANGNMTTGRVHAGGMSSSSTNNYNYTQRNNGDHCQPFSGTPDSMYLWVSFFAANASSQAQVSAIIHGNNDFRSPNDESSPSLYCGKAQGRFARTTQSPSTMQWQQIKVPFNYNGTSTPSYLLLNITTNYTPGEGSSNDSLSIDDIEFIYSAWLTDITVNGTTVEGFTMDVFDYNLTLADTADLSAVVAVQTQADDASHDISIARLTDSTAQVTITVTAEDGVTVKVYHLNLYAPILANVGLDIAAVPTVTAYPNPTTGKLAINAKGHVTLCDIKGRELMAAEGHAVFDLGTLPTGIYMLRCNTSVQRIIKL